MYHVDCRQILCKTSQKNKVLNIFAEKGKSTNKSLLTCCTAFYVPIQSLGLEQPNARRERVLVQDYFRLHKFHSNRLGRRQTVAACRNISANFHPPCISVKIQFFVQFFLRKNLAQLKICQFIYHRLDFVTKCSTQDPKYSNLPAALLDQHSRLQRYQKIPKLDKK